MKVGEARLAAPTRPQGLRPVTRAESRAHQAYEVLRHELLFGPLRTVDRLVEHELARRYDMSRTPVREALQRLSLAGFVAPLVNGGFVRRRLTRRDIREIFQVRRLLEAHAVQALALPIPPEVLDSLERQATRSGGQVEDQAFHSSLVKAASNRTLARAWQWLNDLLAGHPFFAPESERIPQKVPGHDSVVLALREKNARLASERLMEHLRAAESQFLSLVELPVPMRQVADRTVGRRSRQQVDIAKTARRSLSDAAYEELRSAILDGRLAGGNPVAETMVGARLGISRTPVRRALQRLELEGYLERDPSGRLVVHRPSIEEIGEVYVLRELLEGYAARLAAERIADRELNELETLVGQDREAQEQGRIDRLAEINRQFHGLVIMASRNRTLHELAVDLRDRLYGGLTAFAVRDPKDRARFVEEHRMILALLREGEAERADSLVRTHLVKSRERSLAGLHSQQRASLAAGNSAG